MNNIQIINDSYGKPSHVVWVLPIEEYQKIDKITKNSYDYKEHHTIPNEVIGFTIKDNCSILRAWRKYLRFTQKDVANALGIKQSSYSSIEKSENPQKATLEKIAKIFDIPVDLLTLED